MHLLPHPAPRPSRRAGLCFAAFAGPLAGAAGLMILVSACASSPHQASGAGAQPRPATAPAASSRPGLAAPASPAASPTTGATGTPSPAGAPGPAGSRGMGSTGSAAPAYQGPHFGTPQEAMAYMATAYDSDDTADLHAVTDPQGFTALLSMRSSDIDLQLESCTARVTGDYVCSLRYDYVHGQQNSESRVAMLIAAPALNPGWYMYQFISGCGGLANK
jgi:hypothetical protein